MNYKIILIVLTSLLYGIGCTTLNMNERSLKTSCKSGITEYDDGTLSFKCKSEHKPIGKENQ